MDISNRIEFESIGEQELDDEVRSVLSQSHPTIEPDHGGTEPDIPVIPALESIVKQVKRSTNSKVRNYQSSRNSPSNHSKLKPSNTDLDQSWLNFDNPKSRSSGIAKHATKRDQSLN